MTFTEAAVEVLRRAGKPLHYTDIAAQAVEAELLSHVGQLPEATMGARLLAMARREQNRRISLVGDGVYALAEWGLPVESAPPASFEYEREKNEGPAYRSRERHPAIQPEVLVGVRRDDRRRRSDEGGERRRKRYPPPAEVAHQWLRAHGETATLAELAKGLRAEDRIAEALERDLNSLERALREENRRCADSGRTPLFALENGVVRALPPGTVKQAKTREAPKAERREVPREVPVAEEQRRSVTRSLRRRIGALDVSAFERVAVAILEAQGYRDLNMARRSHKEGPLYLARRRWGANDLRYTIRILPPGRDIGRGEVQELRRDLAHFSGQLGILFGTSDCSREAKSEANTPGAAPVMLYGSEGIAEELIETGLGVTRRMVEWIEFDSAFFTSVGAPEAEAEADVDAPSPSPRQQQKEERGRRGKDRRRGRGDDKRDERRNDDRRGEDSRDNEKAASESSGDEGAGPDVKAAKPAKAQDAPTGQDAAGQDRHAREEEQGAQETEAQDGRRGRRRRSGKRSEDGATARESTRERRSRSGRRGGGPSTDSEAEAESADRAESGDRAEPDSKAGADSAVESESGARRGSRTDSEPTSKSEAAPTEPTASDSTTAPSHPSRAPEALTTQTTTSPIAASESPATGKTAPAAKRAVSEQELPTAESIPADAGELKSGEEKPPPTRSTRRTSDGRRRERSKDGRAAAARDSNEADQPSETAGGGEADGAGPSSESAPAQSRASPSAPESATAGPSPASVERELKADEGGAAKGDDVNSPAPEKERGDSTQERPADGSER